MKRLVIGVGEASGDALAAEVVERLPPGVQVTAVAGPRLRALGVTELARAEDLSVMGITEVLPALPRILGIRRTVAQAIQGADLFLAVDAPDFNLPLVKQARGMGVPAVLLGSPQVWAWRKGRAKRIAEIASEVLCLLPFEPPLYERHGGRAVFLGNPVAERCPPLPPGGQDWALLPGSRLSELERLLPTMLQVAEQLPGVTRLSRAPGIPADALVGLPVVDGLVSALTPARAALVASGTATLEVACMGRPQVVIYRVSGGTYAIGRALVRDIEHIALPNLIVGRRAVPEHLQELSVPAIVDDLMAAAETQADFGEELRAALNPQGARQRLADRVAEWLFGDTPGYGGTP